MVVARCSVTVDDMTGYQHAVGQVAKDEVPGGGIRIEREADSAGLIIVRLMRGVFPGPRRSWGSGQRFQSK